MKNFPYKKKFVISQTFLNPSTRYASGVHLGVDLVGLEDKNIYAIQDGKVVLVEFNAGFGNTVIVEQSDGVYSRYSHLDLVIVTNGQRVVSGVTIIGVEGKTGNVVGRIDPRHLDLRVSRVPYHTNKKDLYINPCDYLGFPNTLDYKVIPEGEEMAKNNHVILCKSEIDKRAAGYLADHLGCRIIELDLLPPSVLDRVFENVYVIGSPEKPVAKAVNIFGSDRYETCEKVMSIIKDARSRNN